MWVVDLFSDHVGELAGITTSLIWTLGSLLFATAGRRVGSAAVNEIRLVLATILLFAAHAVFLGGVWPSGIQPRQLVCLLASGVAGLALGDLLYFHCMTLIGPRIGSLLMATAPAMTAALAWQLLDEALGPLGLLGIGITSLGLAAVLSDRRGHAEWEAGQPPRGKRLAVVYGLLAAVGQAVGNVLSKLGGVGLEATMQPIAPLSAVVVRMAGATAAVIVMAILGRHLGRTLRATRDLRAMRLLVLAACLGPTLGVWLYQVSLHRTDAAVTAVLVSLVPIFMIPVARFAYGARPSLLAILGTIVAVAGTSLLFLR